MKNQPKTPPAEPAQYPSPAELLKLAEKEPQRKRLEEYAETIAKLRETGLTYRAIVEWLAKQGIPTDHNEVYRIHQAWCDGAMKRNIEKNRKF